MCARVLTKWLSGFLFIFLIFPKKTSLSPSFNNQKYSRIDKISLDRKLTNNSKIPLRLLDEGLQKNKLLYQLLRNTQGHEKEPGFDITEEEMKRLKLWEKGVIPYYIDPLSFTDKVLRDKIRSFLNIVNAITPLSFVELALPPKKWDVHRWVFFINRAGHLGCADHSIKDLTNEGVQRVVLGYDCMNTGRELEEAVLSIAGIPPQHNSPDRDDYIKILNENILPAKKYLFEKLNNDEWLFHELDYDFESAGHFHQHKYSSNGRATIEFQVQTKIEKNGISEAHSFSYNDIWKIKMLYNYIVRKTNPKVPECNKLFIKAKNFDNQDLNLDQIKPRPKPAKYTGTDGKDEKSDQNHFNSDTIDSGDDQNSLSANSNTDEPNDSNIDDGTSNQESKSKENNGNNDIIFYTNNGDKDEKSDQNHSNSDKIDSGDDQNNLSANSNTDEPNDSNIDDNTSNQEIKSKGNNGSNDIIFYTNNGDKDVLNNESQNSVDGDSANSNNDDGNEKEKNVSGDEKSDDNNVEDDNSQDDVEKSYKDQNSYEEILVEGDDMNGSSRPVVLIRDDGSGQKIIDPLNDLTDYKTD